MEIFPNPAAFLRLATAVVIEAHDESQVTRRSMDELRAVIAAKQRAQANDSAPQTLTPELEPASLHHNSLITNEMVHRSELHHPMGHYQGVPVVVLVLERRPQALGTGVVPAY